jgi:hypothetical protein
MSAHDFVGRYGYLVLVMMVGLISLLFAFRRSRTRVTTKAMNRSVWDYVLLWPLIFDDAKRRARVASGGAFLTTGELVGLIALITLIAASIIFGW